MAWFIQSQELFRTFLLIYALNNIENHELWWRQKWKTHDWKQLFKVLWHENCEINIGTKHIKEPGRFLYYLLALCSIKTKISPL
ncbi:unnamed protein product [Blepharisma stoltei]|uniref:Uncharacterized protein n=1 Tax=Blepharisma stoltei TaxID=1481888 RepID=A0AAU9IBZ6_9CILI|nr:unnamed protein product [Blepharisma stoltei]